MMTRESSLFNPNDPVMVKALELARALSEHCQINNLPPCFVVDGVAYNAAAIASDARKKGYLEGKAYEKDRITELLGLTHKKEHKTGEATTFDSGE